MVSINCNPENSWLPWTAKNNLHSTISIYSSECLRSLHSSRRESPPGPHSAWLWMSSHCDKPSFCREQSSTGCQETLWKGWHPNVFINILKHVRMSKPHLGLYWMYKEQVKCAVLYGWGKGQGQLLNLRIIRPNRGVCFDIWLISKMHHLLLGSF